MIMYNYFLLSFTGCWDSDTGAGLEHLQEVSGPVSTATPVGEDGQRQTRQLFQHHTVQGSRLELCWWWWFRLKNKFKILLIVERSYSLNAIL